MRKVARQGGVAGPGGHHRCDHHDLDADDRQL
jgi:hypothetical protein